MKESNISINEAWKQVQKEPKLWNYITIKKKSIYYEDKEKSIHLTNFKSKNLPSPPYKLNFSGKILTKLSHFANIMSRRPGTEEVTFYALINSPQKGILGCRLDKKMLSIASPPLVWRREQIRENINKKIEIFVKENMPFLFLDIGCGAGFDSLEIERLIHRMRELTGDSLLCNSYLSLNIDIDSKWLRKNKMLTEELFGDANNIERENISALDFLVDSSCYTNLNHYNNLIVSCNGFAEFLTDLELKKLYQGIYNVAQLFEGEICIILPFANKNEKQEKIGNKIGFQFRTKEKSEIVEIIEDIFINYSITYSENNSQIVLFVEKKTGF